MTLPESTNQQGSVLNMSELHSTGTPKYTTHFIQPPNQTRHASTKTSL